MGIMNSLKHYAVAAITATAPATSHSKGGPGKAAQVVQGIVADLGVSASVKRQLIGIEQAINNNLFDLGPFMARQMLKTMPAGSIQNMDDCTIYDRLPSDAETQRSGALVFVKYFSDGFNVVRDPVVELVGFGADMKSAWSNAQKLPRISAAGQGQLQKEKSYMLWYQFKHGEIDVGTVPYPFYLSAVK